jgi:hypothetical protein
MKFVIFLALLLIGCSGNTPAEPPFTMTVSRSGPSIRNCPEGSCVTAVRATIRINNTSNQVIFVENSSFRGAPARFGDNNIRNNVDYEGGCEKQYAIEPGRSKTCSIEYTFRNPMIESNVFPFRISFRGQSVTINR